MTCRNGVSDYVACFSFPGLTAEARVAFTDARDAWLSLPRAGLKKHLLLLPTALWKALDTRSQVAEPRLLFFALKKSFTKRSALAVQWHGAGSRDLLYIALRA